MDRKIIIAVSAQAGIDGGLRSMEGVEKALREIGYNVEAYFVKQSDFESIYVLKEKLGKTRPFCVFNLFKGFKDDRQKEYVFVRILEHINIPHTGNSSYALNTCLNKEKTKQILQYNGIAVPKGFFIEDPEDLANQTKLNFPVFIKPCMENDSVGIDKNSFVDNESDFYKRVKEESCKHKNGIIAEEFKAGKEYSVAILEGKLLGITVIDYSRQNNLPQYRTYNSKWRSDTSEYKLLSPIPLANIEKALKEEIYNMALRIGKTLRCSEYFKVDIRENNGQLFVLDVNPNPDINSDSSFMKQAYACGYKYNEVINRILSSALTVYPVMEIFNSKERKKSLSV